jgi:large subunit ribosomal protein L9
MKVVINKTGEVKEVSDGHARNYLIPKGLALPATDEAIKAAEESAALHQANTQKMRETWEAAAESLKKDPVTVHMKANTDGTLFAKVSLSAILTAVQEQRSVVLKTDWLDVPEDLKQTGVVDIVVTFPSGARTTFQLDIQAE